MDTKASDILLTAIAPIAWATTYVITKLWLPPGRPFFSAVVRALPVGLVLVALRRQLPRGSWWWKAGVLGVLNIGLFFGLLFVGAYRLPGGLASTLQATGPLAVLVLAGVLLGERPTALSVGASLLGLAGVALLVLRAGVRVDWVGVVAALASVAVSSLGYVLVRRWRAPVDLLTLTGWQLTAGGLLLVPVALLTEGAPPALSTANVLAYLWLAVAGTAVAYVVWFRGLQRMPAASASLIGLVNPVVATILGVAVSHERFGWPQAMGMVLVFTGVLLGQRPVVTALRKGLRRRA